MGLLSNLFGKSPHKQAERIGSTEFHAPADLQVSYEVGDIMGSGKFSVFFKIKDHPRLGAKVQFERDASRHKRALEQEWKKAKVLQALKVPVPRYAGIIKIRVPKDIKFLLEKAQREERIHFFSSMVKKLPEDEVFYGLVMENIESDLTMVSQDHLHAMYTMEYQRLKKLGIHIKDSGSKHNVLWSKKKNKMYFIDFEAWVFPAKFGTYDHIQLVPDTGF